jgi:heme exporter protein C
MKQLISNSHAIRSAAPAGLIAGLVGLSVLMIFFYAPTEATMGDVQRILYLHVAVAWCGLAGFAASAVCSGVYLIRRRLVWDHAAQAAAETGWLCTTLTLATGSLWAHEAWNTWWTWEPRLTSSLILWLVYAGIFLMRSGILDPHRRARLCGVLTILGASDVPLVLMATRWFRGVHPVTPEMDPRMRLVLLVSAISFTAFFAFLALVRRRQLETAERLEAFEAELNFAE